MAHDSVTPTDNDCGRAAAVIARNQAQFEHASQRPLLRQMADGTVTAERFGTYIAIEHSFVQTAARTLGYCVWQAPTWSALTTHAVALKGLVGEQAEYFAARNRPGTLLPAGSDALDEVVQQAVHAGYPAVVTCMYTAESLYLSWCRAAVDRSDSAVAGPADEWIRLHTSGDFAGGVEALGLLVDAMDPTTVPDDQLDHWFTRMLTAENRFHDSPLHEGAHP